MSFKSKKHVLTKDSKGAESLPDLPNQPGATHESLPYLVDSEVVNQKGYLSESDLGQKSWSPAASKEGLKLPIKSLSTVKDIRRKQYCTCTKTTLKPVPEEAILKPDPLNEIGTDSLKRNADESSTEYLPSGSGNISATPRGHLYFVYAEGDSGGLKVRTRMKDTGMKCLDCHRDGCYGQPELAQSGRFMEEAAWVILYLSEVFCDNFLVLCQMAIKTAECSKKEKVANLVSSKRIKIPIELKLFPVIHVEDKDWLSVLEDIVCQKPEDFSRQRCSLKNCPLSGSSQSVQSDCLDIVQRTDQLGQSGASPQSKKICRLKQIYDKKVKLFN